MLRSFVMLRPVLVAVGAGLALTGCALGLFGERYPVYLPETGFVVGDEASAVRVGAAILAQGGTAADAATATYFALAATYPVSAGLAGGGICVVHDRASGKRESFEFLTRDSRYGGAFALAGNVRGFAELQKAYGKFTWSHLVAPGEELARNGFKLSEALSAHIDTALSAIQRDPDLAAQFLDAQKNLKPVGTLVSNPRLAHTMALIRDEGPDAYYKGITAKKIVEYTEGESIGFDLDEMAAYKVYREPVQSVQMGKLTVSLPSKRLGSGAFAGALLTKLTEVNASQDIGAATRLTLDEFEVDSLPRDLGATGFAAIDSKGQAVSCAVTMNGPFGGGHVAGDTGVALARSPKASSTGFSSAFLSPAIATREGGNLALIGVGAGGPNGTASLAYTLLISAREGTLSDQEDIRTTGVAPYSTVNVIACLDSTCSAISDPGTSGLGANQKDDGSAGKRPRRGWFFF